MLDSSSFGLLGALHDESLVDVRDNTTASNGGLDESVKLLVAADRQLQVARSDSLYFKVFASVTCKLEHLSSEVFKDSSTVNCRSGTNTAVSADSALQESVNSSNGELYKNT